MCPVIVQEKFEVLGDSVQQSKLEILRAQTTTFREKLEEFALNHKCAPAQARCHTLMVESRWLVQSVTSPEACCCQNGIPCSPARLLWY